MESPIVSSAEMRAAEQSAFDRGIAVEALMDEAGTGVARAVRQFFPSAGICAVYAGKGHNGGDALVAARALQVCGWKIELHLAYPEDECTELTRKKLAALTKGKQVANAPASHLIILDGLLGLGAKPPLRDPIREAARQINRRRITENAFVFALDIPTGLDGDSGEAVREDCVRADFTIAIGYAKRGLVADSALDFVGRLEVVALPELKIAAAPDGELVTTARSLGPILPRRRFSAYKNLFGRIGVVAGSEGFLGAAILTTKGALRAGAGLVNVFVPKELYSLVAPLAPDEAMVKPVRSYTDLLDQENVDVWAIGPGLGVSRASEILKVIEQTEKPMVVDADGLNMLASKLKTLERCRGPRLLTPHPGEMKRLFDYGKMSRATTARHFCDEFKVTLLLKGSRTIVCERDRPISYNSTGNPGMATGGSGDVLTGVLAGLLGQKLGAYDAARVGAWVCGRAAEIAVFDAGQ
ncbi:MAG TPA: NAD(P)H-hydrate dehydratase, partial [Chthoniobacterales bacterium]